jgi:hypothetical protein
MSLDVVAICSIEKERAEGGVEIKGWVGCFAIGSFWSCLQVFTFVLALVATTPASFDISEA